MRNLLLLNGDGQLGLGRPVSVGASWLASCRRAVDVACKEVMITAAAAAAAAAM